MIYYNIVRRFCTIASVQLKTSLKAKLVKRMLDQNSQSFIVFKKLTDIPEIKELENIFTKAGYELVFDIIIDLNKFKIIFQNKISKY
jgi:hypothetical protein